MDLPERQVSLTLILSMAISPYKVNKGVPNLVIVSKRDSIDPFPMLLKVRLYAPKKAFLRQTLVDNPFFLVVLIQEEAILLWGGGV